jgi:two-component system LytT family sensor kinase
MELPIFRRKHNIFTIILALCVLFIVSSFITFLFVGKDLLVSFPRYLDGIAYGFCVGLAFWLGNWFIGWFTGNRINWRANPQKANIISLLMFLLFGIIASVGVPFGYHVIFHPEWKNLFNTIVIDAFINLSVDVIFVSIFYSKYLVKYYAQSLITEEELKRENLIARYEALKNQVNPHFLFNSLNTLTGIVEQNPGRAVEFIKKLSDIYRYVLEQRDKELVAIDDELKFVDNYFHLAKARHGDGLTLITRIDKRNSLIAPLGLQILVENAIKHNIISDDMPLKIEISIKDYYLEVRNNLQKKTSVADNNSIGLENLKNRYSYLTDRPVKIIEADNYFVVKLPVINQQKK